VGTVALEWTEDEWTHYCRHVWRFRGWYSASPISPLALAVIAMIAAAVTSFFAWLFISEVSRSVGEVVVPVVERVPGWAGTALALGASAALLATLVRAVRR